MGKLVNIIFVIVTLYVSVSKCARILGVVPTPSYSHQVVYQPLWRELSLRGHQVTVITTDPIKDPSLVNLTEIDLGFSYKIFSDIMKSMVDNRDNLWKLVLESSAAMEKVTEEQMQSSGIQKLLKNETEHFDLMMIEYFMPTMYAFAERFNCPYIGMTSLDAPASSYRILGNPVHPVLNPDAFFGFVGELTILEKLFSIIIEYALQFFTTWYSFPKEDLIIKKYFGEGYPPIADIQKDVSMLFVNTDNIFHTIRPLVPTIIQIGGGIHLKPSKPLPQDLQRVLDNATQGFIYFSLGSNVKSKDLSETGRNILLEAFADLPYLVLWKFELEELPNKLDNVIISKWFPQQDVFKHPNIKLFITQGGLQSMDEAIYNHVPLVGMPFFFDQTSNIKKMVWKGLGLAVDYKTLEKDHFKSTILEVINNPSYRNKIIELSTLALDQPMTGLERAVWWTEYVLRHNGAKHLRSPALDLPSYQYYLLDVIGVCLLVIFLVSYLSYKTLAILLKFVRNIGWTIKVKVKKI